MSEPINTDFRITVAQAKEMAGAVTLPSEFRLMTLQKYAKEHGNDAALALCAELLGLANAVVENCHTNAADLLVMQGMHPHDSEKINMPTMLGALLGIALAAEAPKQEATCHGCAYRLGSIANQCLSTVTDADYQAQGLDGFCCHESDDHPPCRGHAQNLKSMRKFNGVIGAES